MILRSALVPWDWLIAWMRRCIQVLVSLLASLTLSSQGRTVCPMHCTEKWSHRVFFHPGSAAASVDFPVLACPDFKRKHLFSTVQFPPDDQEYIRNMYLQCLKSSFLKYCLYIQSTLSTFPDEFPAKNMLFAYLHYSWGRLLFQFLVL